VCALCVAMCASCVKILSYAFTSCLGLIIALQPASIRFLKIDALQDVLFTSKSFLSFLNGRVPWHNPFEEKQLTRNERIKFAALEQQLQRFNIAA